MKSIKEQLKQLAEPEFQKFSSRLLPGVEHILGVRLPNLRKIAKEAVKEDWIRYYKECTMDSFEEIMLQGMIIGYVKEAPEIIFPLIKEFVLKIDNWSICDSFCSGLKFTKEYKKEMLDFLLPYLKSEKEYLLRFGVVMLLTYYIEEKYIDQVLLLLDEAKKESYYVKMAVAWAISVCYVKFPEKGMEYLKKNSLDDFTYNKSLQKITESRCVEKEKKEKIRSLKK